MAKQKTYENAILTMILTYIIILLILGSGWVMNVIKIIGNFDLTNLTGLMVVRIIGIPIFPVRSIVGWF